MLRLPVSGVAALLLAGGASAQDRCVVSSVVVHCEARCAGVNATDPDEDPIGQRVMRSVDVLLDLATSTASSQTWRLNTCYEGTDKDTTLALLSCAASFLRPDVGERLGFALG